MERWKKLNVYVSVGGVILALVGLIFVKYNPLILCISFFGLGIAWKGFKNIYKNVDPPDTEKLTDPYNNNTKKVKKKKKKKR